MLENRYYLYRHVRSDKNEPFYIGIGTKRKDRPITTELTEYHRAYEIRRRSEFWNKIVSKTEYEIEIMLESDDYNFIKQKEIEFIALYGRRDNGTGILVNLTDGGEGMVGNLKSEETRKKLSESQKGEKSLFWGKPAWNRGKKMSQESIEKRLAATEGKWKHSKKVIDIKTGQIWNTIDAAAKHHGLTGPTLSKYFSGRYPNKLPSLMLLSEYEAFSE